MTALPQDFKEFIALLNKHSVDYLLIGGYAVAYYGFIRATNDMDVWILISPENARKTHNALIEFGFDMPGLTDKMFLVLYKSVWVAQKGLTRAKSSFPVRM